MPFEFNRATDLLAQLTAGGNVVLPDVAISVHFRCSTRPSRECRDDWLRLELILSQPAVYEAFGISSLPLRLRFHSARQLEIIGTLGNFLLRVAEMSDASMKHDVAISESRRVLDLFVGQDYWGAEAFSISGNWCDWFIGDDSVDETVLFGHRDDWWLLAVTTPQC